MYNFHIEINQVGSQPKNPSDFTDVKFLDMNWVVVGVNSTIDISTQWNHLLQSLDLFW